MAEGSGENTPRRPGKARAPAGKKRGGLRLKRLGPGGFELDHPRCVPEMELDYEEGIALWREGDVEAARDALRFALQGCGDNLWVHVALGRIALEEFNDPGLARGHFGYAYELAQRALPPGFTGRLPRARLANRPFYDAIDGLATCYDALGKPDEAAALRNQAHRLSGEGRPAGPAR
jgi:tetratricopeptide (TPR) repeat protein